MSASVLQRIHFISRHRLAIAFALAGVMTRFTYRYFESRWQILIFIALAAAFEIVQIIRGHSPSWPRLVTNSLAAAISILAVKFITEYVYANVLRLMLVIWRSL